MNLQEENIELKEAMKKADECAQDLFRYINSEKFRCGSKLDGYVSIKDVEDRLRLVRNELMI